VSCVLTRSDRLCLCLSPRAHGREVIFSPEWTRTQQPGRPGLQGLPSAKKTEKQAEAEVQRPFPQLPPWDLDQGARSSKAGGCQRWLQRFGTAPVVFQPAMVTPTTEEPTAAVRSGKPVPEHNQRAQKRKKVRSVNILQQRPERRRAVVPTEVGICTVW
jgi:hypothetical protein